jgi:hypothetical protein
VDMCRARCPAETKWCFAFHGKAVTAGKKYNYDQRSETPLPVPIQDWSADVSRILATSLSVPRWTDRVRVFDRTHFLFHANFTVS